MLLVALPQGDGDGLPLRDHVLFGLVVISIGDVLEVRAFELGEQIEELYHDARYGGGGHNIFDLGLPRELYQQLVL